MSKSGSYSIQISPIKDFGINFIIEILDSKGKPASLPMKLASMDAITVALNMIHEAMSAQPDKKEEGDTDGVGNH